VCILLATVVYALLRRSLERLSRTAFGDTLGKIMRKVFSLNLLLFALAGFFSVSLRSCNKESYESIIADKTYLISKNQEQLGTSMLYICVALLLFGLLVSVGLSIIRKKGKDAKVQQEVG
jgi:hypothetical protein